MAEGGVDVGSDVPPLSKAAEQCQVISKFCAEDFESLFSRRALDRGSLFAMEAFVDDLKVKVKEDKSVEIHGRCYASFRKNVRRDVEIQLNADLKFVDSFCQCTAGQNKCAHAAGVLLFVAQNCRHVRVLEQQVEEEMEEDSAVDSGEPTTPCLPCTSKPRAWGLPAQKRRVDATESIESLNFKRVALDRTFSAVRETEVQLEPRPAALRGIRAADLHELREKLERISLSDEKKMVCLLYQARFEDSGNDPEPTSGPFDDRRPKPLRLPARFNALYSSQHQCKGAPSQEQLDTWMELFSSLLPSVDYAAVEVATRGQADCDDWYLERVCRVTASKLHAVVSRTRNFDSLAIQHLYHAPPTNLPSLRFGRDKEPVAVDLYAKKFPERTVSLSGLVIHPDLPYLAASPDRLVVDPGFDPKDGLIEVKCLYSAKDTPDKAARARAVPCLVIDGEEIKINENHAYYYQMQCQMACTRRQWCDLVYAHNDILCRRVHFAPEKWNAWIPKVESFFSKFYAPEIVYPQNKK